MKRIDRRQLLQGAVAAVVTTTVVAQPVGVPVLARPRHERLGEAMSLDGRLLPELDESRANKLPSEMTGYWEKSFDVGGATRTAKVYISPETPIRSYYTVIAAPDGVDTAEFLRKTSWRDIADEREEALFVLEPGDGGWGSAAQEAAYVDAAINFYQSNGYFSIYGEHYFVGYGAGAPVLEAWAVANPLRVISQVYLDSPGLSDEYLASYAGREFDGDSPGFYTDVDFPEGFDLIRHDEVVLPTWYLAPERGSIDASLAYWKQANDTGEARVRDRILGTVYEQRADSERWMTSHAGPIAEVAVSDRGVSYWNKRTTRQIVDFLTYFTRYENSFAYGNQLYPRADYDALGVERRTMMIEGLLREFLVYVPDRAGELWGDAAPVVFVWPGNTQTAKVFFDAAPWWQVAEREGCILAVIGEHYSSPTSVTHRDTNAFYLQLRDLMVDEYPVDPTRFYSTGQSLGSLASQEFAVAFPEYFAAVASTSFTAAPDSSGNVNIDGVDYQANSGVIPNYHVYGYGDLPFISGTLWDGSENRLDSWAEYFLSVNDLTLADVDALDGELSGFNDRFRTWTWNDSASGVPVVKLTRNLYRSHNTMASECPLMWDYLRHFAHEVRPDGSVVRYYSESGFSDRTDVVEF